MTKNKLKLNDSKTEFFIAVNKQDFPRLVNIHLNLQDVTFLPSFSVKNLELFLIHRWRWMNTSHTYQQLWTFIFRICGEFGASSTRTHVILQFVLWWLVDLIMGMHSFTDLPHKVFPGCSVSRTRLLKLSLQLGVVNMSLMEDLHWLPFQQRIKFKLLIHIYKCLHDQGSGYLTDHLHIYSPRRTGLRSSLDSTLPLFLNHQNW